MENFNYHNVASALADFGYDSMRLNNDWQGADFIAVKGEKAQGNKLSSKKVHKLLLVEKEIEQDQVLVEDSSSLLSDNINESEPTDNDTDSKNKIIIDENSTDNQFKLEL